MAIPQQLGIMVVPHEVLMLSLWLITRPHIYWRTSHRSRQQSHKIPLIHPQSDAWLIQTLSPQRVQNLPEYTLNLKAKWLRSHHNTVRQTQTLPSTLQNTMTTVTLSRCDICLISCQQFGRLQVSSNWPWTVRGQRPFSQPAGEQICALFACLRHIQGKCNFHQDLDPS